ncbi:MAG: hypothetical protein E7566_07235 [Ruminococcaceae bacterium]|nr:hypothetical protein [Oscillospiraceae bacterium]
MKKALKKGEKDLQNKQRLSKNTKIKIILASVFLLLFALFAVILIGNFTIKITRHQNESNKIIEPLRIALISDLHQKSALDFEERIAEKIEKESPDLIFMAGDFISREDANDNDFKSLNSLIRSLKEIAPVYFSLGNHERFNSKIEDICHTVEYAGGILLDSEYTNVTIKGNKLCIGGLRYYRSWDEESNAFLKRFCTASDDVYTILLCHHPEFYLWGIKNYDIDLTLSGHTHGGMVKLPFIGPVYSPEQGWFPEYAAGFYEFPNGYLAVTTGLGSSPEAMPRIFNRPEIMIIDLK